MAGLNDTAKAAALDHLGTLITHISIHSAQPDASGSNEVVGSTRQSVSWAAAAGGNLDSSGTQEFAVTEGTTIHSVGLWGAASGGTFYGYKALAAAETFSNDGTFTVNDIDININDA